DARENVAPQRHGKHLVGELDVADFLIVEIVHLELHGEAPPPSASGGASSAAGASGSAASSATVSSGSGSAVSSPRSAAGNGTPSGGFRLTASRISTQP